MPLRRRGFGGSVPRGSVTKPLRVFAVSLLQDTAVDTQRSRVVRLVQEPEPTPFISHGSLVFGGKDQLFRSLDWISRVHGNEASGICADCNRQ